MQISAHPAFSALVQRDGGHWGSSPLCIVGVVTLLIPVDPESVRMAERCSLLNAFNGNVM